MSIVNFTEQTPLTKGLQPKGEWVPMYQLNSDSRYTEPPAKPYYKPFITQSTAAAMAGAWGYGLGVALREAEEEKRRQAELNSN